ncbi:phosphoribosyltransferase [Microbacterium sp.]|uniref:phosphoribosyltransferase n=1 Tax=Microbacterium sp. TaxID=51671 RepID=UPI003A8CDCE6
MALYADRRHAGATLAGALEDWHGTDAVVVGIARGGVVVAHEVAHRLALPLRAIAARKLGAPDHEELAIGAIAGDVEVVDERAVHGARVSADELTAIVAREHAALEARRAVIADDEPFTDLTVLLVGDGVATGATARAAARALRAMGARTVVLAVPVAPAAWVADAADIEEVVCPHRAPDFWAVGQFYDDFSQTSDDDVARLLRDR